jgi:hypothetical protein
MTIVFSILLGEDSEGKERAMCYSGEERGYRRVRFDYDWKHKAVSLLPLAD